MNVIIKPRMNYHLGWLKKKAFCDLLLHNAARFMDEKDQG